MGVMGGTQRSRLVVSLLALAIGPLPATAQSSSEAVVCVGSETRSLATNAIRSVFTEDIEVVYRTGVDIGRSAQIERTLSSDLGSYPEVWCAWSGPGDQRFRSYNDGSGYDVEGDMARCRGSSSGR